MTDEERGRAMAHRIADLLAAEGFSYTDSVRVVVYMLACFVALPGKNDSDRIMQSPPIGQPLFKGPRNG